MQFHQVSIELRPTIKSLSSGVTFYEGRSIHNVIVVRKTQLKKIQSLLSNYSPLTYTHIFNRFIHALIAVI